VTLTVNDRPIPFNMKIGEAGEAFFIFETTGDVPDDLITSPLLTATQSPNFKAQTEDIQPEIFSANGDTIDDQTHLQNGRSPEPDFLDLDAPSRQSAADQVSGISLTKPVEESRSDVTSSSTLPTLMVGIETVLVNVYVN
jgi:phosphatidate phosphatase LPIN